MAMVLNFKIYQNFKLKVHLRNNFFLKKCNNREAAAAVAVV
jgi:hypothetical protein